MVPSRTLHYTAVEGKTSSLECAHELGRLTESRHMVVNLIPLIVHAEEERSCPPPDHIKKFQSIVASYGTICNVRLNLSVEQSEIVKRQMKLDKHSFMDVPTDIEDLGFWQKLAFVRFQGWNKEALRQRLERRRSAGVPREIFAKREIVDVPAQKDAVGSSSVVGSIMELVGDAASAVVHVVARGASTEKEQRELSAEDEEFGHTATDFRHHHARRWVLSAALVTVVVCRIIISERRR